MSVPVVPVAPPLVSEDSVCSEVVMLLSVLIVLSEDVSTVGADGSDVVLSVFSVTVSVVRSTVVEERGR